MQDEAASVAEVLQRIRTRLARQIETERNLNSGDQHPAPSSQANIEHLRELLGEVQALHGQVGVLNPRHPGIFNDLIQQFKKALLRILRWYSRPIVRYEAVNIQYLGEVIQILERQEAQLKSLGGRLGLAADDFADLRLRTLGKLNEIGIKMEPRATDQPESMQTQLDILEKTAQTVANLRETASVKSPAARMEADWDKRAREDARYYIDTGHSETEEAFERSGEWDLTNHILQGIELSSRATVLEIGCGIGRLLKPLARRAGHVIGVDISSEMVRKARARLAEIPNIQIHKTDNDLSMVESSSVDYCFSFVVFQHVPDKQSIFNYFEETSRILREGGIFRFQTNQRPEKFMESHVAGTWDGVGLEHFEVVAHLEEAGFKILDTWGEMTHYAWYTAEKVKNAGTDAPEGLVQFRATVVDSAAAEKFLKRIGAEMNKPTLDALLSRRVAWREALDFLIEKWSPLNNEEFIRNVHSALLNREIGREAIRPNLSMMEDGRLTRSVFLDCLVSSKEFRDVLAGIKG